MRLFKSYTAHRSIEVTEKAHLVFYIKYIFSVHFYSIRNISVSKYTWFKIRWYAFALTLHEIHFVFRKRLTVETLA